MKPFPLLALGLVAAVAGGLVAAEVTNKPVSGPGPAGVGTTRVVPTPRASSPEVLVAALVEALQDDDGVVAQNAGTALVCLSPKSEPALIAGLTHKDKKVRGRSAEILGRLGALKKLEKSEVILEALVKALKDKEVEVRRAASGAICQILGGMSTTPTPACCYAASPNPPAAACYGPPQPTTYSSPGSGMYR